MIFADKIKTILYLLGSLLIILAIILFIPLILSICMQEGKIVYRSFYIPLFSALIPGIALNRIKTTNTRMSLSTGMIICGLGWLLFSLLGGLPFKIALNKSFIDSFFESVSGFTTTGITVFQNLQQLPRSILLWRSLMQWLGGLGILAFFLLITFRSEGGLWQLFTAETHKINTSRPVPNIFKSVKILWLIYIVFTILIIILLSICGLSLFDAFIHGFTTISTGGFSSYDQSIGHFQQAGYTHYKTIEYIIIFFMLMGGINFFTHYKVWTGNIKEMFINSEMKYFWSIIFIIVAVIIAGMYITEGGIVFGSFEEKFRKTLFQVVSVMTTTGYETQNIGSAFFPAVAKQLFLLLMFIGGCVGSTSGGIKVIRVAVLNKLFVREIKKYHLPKRALMPVTIDKNTIPAEEIQRIAAMFFAWLFLILIGGGITAIFSDLDAFASLSGMFSAVSNIGPSYISVARMTSFSPVIKLTYILGMLAGRLEILPVLLLFTKRAWK